MTLRGMGFMHMVHVIKEDERMCRRPLGYDANGDVRIWRVAFCDGSFIYFVDVDAEMARIGLECGRILLTREDVDAIDWEEYEWTGNPNVASYAPFAVTR